MGTMALNLAVGEVVGPVVGAAVVETLERNWTVGGLRRRSDYQFVCSECAVVRFARDYDPCHSHHYTHKKNAGMKYGALKEGQRGLSSEILDPISTTTTKKKK